MVKYLGVLLAGVASATYDCDWAAGTCTTDNWCNGKVNGYHFMETTAEHLEGKYISCNWGVYTENQCADGHLWYVTGDMNGSAMGWNGFCNFADESVQEIGGSGGGSDDSDDAPAEPVCDYTTGLCVSDNWCSGKESGYYAAESAEDQAAGKYIMCNWGAYEEMTCASGIWTVPVPTPEWASQWYGFCAEVEDATTASATTADANATTADPALGTCDLDPESATFGACVTNDWCSGKISGMYRADDTTECEAGKYYMCNWGHTEELFCEAGFRWYNDRTDKDWATQWYGFCDFAENVAC